jgi:hypoxia up-regulated 1
LFFYFLIRLRELDRDELAKHRKEEARNSLEGYLYRVRDLLDAQNPETPFKKCSQEAERAAIAEKLEETISWLHDKGDLAETSQFYDKRNVIEYVLFPNFPFSPHDDVLGHWRARSSTDTRRLKRSRKR